MKGREIKILILIGVLVITGILIFLASSPRQADKETAADKTSPTTTLETVQVAPPALPPAKNEPQLRAAGAYLLANGESLYAVSDGKTWPMASLTKLMTALAADDLIPSQTTVIVTEEAVGASGDIGEFKAGERFSARDLEEAMLVASSNDAAKALALHYGESELVSYMNKRAEELGMTSTSFADTTGLSPSNLSTVGDLKTLVRAIWLDYPDIFAITRRSSITLVDIDTGRSRKLLSTNAFAGRPDFLGGKTGRLPEANGNLISIFKLEDKSSPVIVIVLGANDRFKETEKILAKL